MTRKALLLCAGHGSRLWPLSAVRAKPAVPFLGVPLVRRLALSLIHSGVDQLAVNLHHKPESVIKALEGVSVMFSHEDHPLGTSGALHPLRDFFGNDPFWTVNAKISVPYMPPSREVSLNDTEILLAFMTRGERDAPYTRVVLTDDEGMFTGFTSHDSHDGTGFVFTGIQYLTPDIWSYLPPPGFSHFPAVYSRIWEEGFHTAASVMDMSWLEFSTLDRYWQNNIRSGGDSPEFWGNGVRVERVESVTESILWDNVTVEAGARVHASIIADGVTIKRGRCVEGSVVVPLSSVEGDPRVEVMDDTGIVSFGDADY